MRKKFQKLCDEKKFAKLHLHTTPIKSRVLSKNSEQKTESNIETHERKQNVPFVRNHALRRKSTTKDKDNSNHNKQNKSNCSRKDERNEYFGGGSTVVIANIDSNLNGDVCDQKKDSDTKLNKKNRKSKK